MNKRIAVCLSAALLAATVTTAAAENRAGTFTLTPFVGGYTFDGVQHLDTMPVVGVRGGYNFTDRIGAEAVFDYVRTDGTKFDNDTDVYNYHLDLLYHFFPKAKAVPFLMAGYGGMTVDSKGGETTKGAFNYGLGLKYALTEAMHLRGEVRHLIFKQSDRSLNNVEYGIGLGFPFGGARPVAKAAAAPAPAAVTPPPAPVIEPPKAVPPPPAPAPTATISATPSPVEKGAPATITWECKNATAADIQPGIGAVPLKGTRTVTAAEATVYTLICNGAGGDATAQSKLAVSEPLQPACTITAAPGVITEGQSSTVTWDCRNVSATDLAPEPGAVQAKGSRTVLPRETTTYTVKGTGAGAPAAASATVKVNPLPPEKLTMALDVEFDTAKADIKKKYHDEIGRVAAFLKEYPGVTGTIEGHTDNVGGKEMNMKLSQRRADAVKKYLVGKFGIDPSRLSAVGYGPTRPIADNATPAGRQKNRRTVATFETVVVKKK